MSNQHTPNLDAWEAARQEALDEYHCDCGRPHTCTRTEWLTQHGVLTKKRTASGWRRQWQCKSCLNTMGGDGVNAGPPTHELPEFIGLYDPRRQAVSDRRKAMLNALRADLPSKREAWFRDHDLYLQTERWDSLRGQVMQRDGGRCTKCGAEAHHVHHRTYDRWQNEDLDDLESLCRGCHEKEHTE